MAEPERKSRWYCPTPGRFVVGVLLVEILLLLSERFSWFAFNEKKGWTVLIAVGVVCAAVLAMLLWFGVSLLWRWRFQFSLRMLLLSVMVVAVPCSWLAVRMQRARRQREAVEALERSGRVYYDYHFLQDTVPDRSAEPPTPAWLRGFLCTDFFAEAEEASLKDVNDEDLVWLQELDNLRALVLFSSRVTDAGLKHLQEMSSFEALCLECPQITDVGLKHLRKLTGLRRLTLICTQGTHLPMESLGEFDRLEELKLDGEQVTDDWLLHLKDLENLEVLIFIRTQVTDEGIAELQQALPNCTISCSAGGTDTLPERT